MMWHWNSLWAPAPGDPPAIDDPALWRAPWSPEQLIALQARSWEAMLSAAHSWWSMALSAWPVANGWSLPVWNGGTADTQAATTGTKPLTLVKAAEPEVAQAAPEPRKRAPARKR